MLHFDYYCESVAVTNKIPVNYVDQYCLCVNGSVTDCASDIQVTASHHGPREVNLSP
jgi:hypothetical protein